jgi:hypothetical protein
MQLRAELKQKHTRWNMIGMNMSGVFRPAYHLQISGRQQPERDAAQGVERHGCYVAIVSSPQFNKMCFSCTMLHSRRHVGLVCS